MTSPKANNSTTVKALLHEDCSDQATCCSMR